MAVLRRIGKVAAGLAAVAALGVGILAATGQVLLPGSAPRFEGAVSPDSQDRGALMKVEHIASYGPLAMRVVLSQADLPERIPIANGVDLYRLTYRTEHLGKPVMATGLLTLPRGVDPKATVMWLNGTDPTRVGAPSAGNNTGFLISASYAGNGSLLVGPDYVGLGLSPSYHPYFYAPTTISAAVDMLRASQTAVKGFGRSWQPKLLLSGFSHGGWATMLVQRHLEEQPEPNITLLGGASMAPPVNLADGTVPYALGGPSKADSLYLANMLQSYSRIYGQPLESVVHPQFAKILPKLFDGYHDTDLIIATLPRDPRDMFTPEAAAAFEPGKTSWFREALRKNAAGGWLPRKPLHVFIGIRDEDVTKNDPLPAARAMKAAGGNVVIHEMPDYDHQQVVYHATPIVLKWIDELVGMAG